MKKEITIATGIIVVGLMLVLAPASMTEAGDFYQGKTIRFVVGAPAGGGYDTYTRAIARHLGKHVPGNPSMVVENMDGAGSLIAANYVFNKAEPDGLTVGVWISGQIIRDALGDPSIKLTAASSAGSARPATVLPPVRLWVLLDSKPGMM
jgi:tripartite-type tricarboxylate transporter receptor subunit TctC